MSGNSKICPKSPNSLNGMSTELHTPKTTHNGSLSEIMSSWILQQQVRIHCSFYFIFLPI